MQLETFIWHGLDRAARKAEIILYERFRRKKLNVKKIIKIVLELY